MYKMIVVPVVLLLFVLQTNILFASENAVTNEEVSAVATEAKAEVSTACYGS